MVCAQASDANNILRGTFDADGQLFYSSNGTRPAWHAIQGAYYHKQFDKHGELHNPYTYGYFQFVPHENYRGGHVTCGGTFYYGESFPPEFRGKYIANNLLSHEVHWHSFFATGSTFRSRREGELLVTNDTWCAPVRSTICGRSTPSGTDTAPIAITGAAFASAGDASEAALSV